MTSGGTMRFHQSVTFLEMDQLLPMAVATDELGYRAVENPVNVHDLHATMLALMGIDHERLTTKFQGLDVRLTGIAGEVVKDVMA